MLSWYGTTIIIYFIIILLAIEGIFNRMTKYNMKFRCNLTGLLTILGLACVPILRLIIMIGLIYWLFCDIGIIIKELEEDEE